MENEKRHIWILIAIALVFCAVLIGYNLFFVKEPQAIVIETDIAESDTEQSLGEGYIVPTAKVNINTASAEQLDEELEGIGRNWTFFGAKNCELSGCKRTVYRH